MRPPMSLTRRHTLGIMLALHVCSAIHVEGGTRSRTRGIRESRNLQRNILEIEYYDLFSNSNNSSGIQSKAPKSAKVSKVSKSNKGEESSKLSKVPSMPPHSKAPAIIMPSSAVPSSSTPATSSPLTGAPSLSSPSVPLVPTNSLEPSRSGSSAPATPSTTLPSATRSPAVPSANAPSIRPSKLLKTKAPSSKLNGATKAPTTTIPKISKAPTSKLPKLPKKKLPKKDPSKSEKGSVKGSIKGSKKIQKSKKSKSSVHPAGPTTSPSPNLAPSSIPVAPPPTQSPQVNLSPFSVGYAIPATRIPGFTEVEQVAGVTQGYLESIFNTSYATLVRLDTTLSGDKLFLNAPYQINYTATAIFQASSTVPTLQELDSLLMASFTGSNADTYVTLLQGLNATNIFSLTSAVFFDEYPDTGTLREQENATESNAKSLPMIAAIVSGAVALMTVGVAYAYRNRKNSQDSELQTFDEGLGIGKSCGVGDQTCAESYTRNGDDVLSEVTRECVSETDIAYSFVGSPALELHDEIEVIDEDDESSVGMSDIRRAESLDEQIDQINVTSSPDVDQGSDSTNHVYKRTDSEDEDVPLRVVDLIRFFTPQKPLEPPGNTRGR